MAFLDKTLGGIVIGFGAALLGRSALSSNGSPSSVTSQLRPLAKGLVRATLVASNQVRVLANEAIEQVSDLIAEVKAEHDAEATASEDKHKRAT